MKIYTFLLFVCLGLFQIRAQELPPLQSFYPQNYNGGDQNWGITQDSNNIIYVANNKGLLSYNGSKWHLYPTPNQSIMRSVLAQGERIYSGFYGDFGYWDRTNTGTLAYTSLMAKFKLAPLEDEEFWGIATMGDWLVFQSLDRIYIINENLERVNIIDSETTLTEMILVDDTIIFQKIDQGIFKIENGQQMLLTEHPSLKSEVLVDVFKRDSKLFFVTQSKGLYEWDHNQVKKSDSRINEVVDSKSIYSGQQLSNNQYAVGTISNGLMLFDGSENLLYQINQTNGLSNNTVLDVFEDSLGNIWLAMDNGISVINLNSQFKAYYDQEGLLGTVYTSALFNDNLYLGTNQGLFRKNQENSFELLEGTEGQVWGLKELNGNLFCGHDRGTFIVDKQGEVSRVSSVQGAWDFKLIPDYPNLVLQGNYNGLYVLENRNAEWSIRNKIEGFDTSTRYFEFIKGHNLVVSHEYKGIYYLSIDEKFSKVKEISRDSLSEAVNSSIVKYKNHIFFGSKSGIYRYNENIRRFEYDSSFSKLMSYSPYVSGKLIVTDEGSKLWYASENGFSYLEPDNLTGDITITNLALPLNKRATKSGYEHLLKLSENNYLIGTTEGYLTIETGSDQIKETDVIIDAVITNVLGESSRKVNFIEENEFSSNSNSFEFSFYAPVYDIFSHSQFSYRLVGYYDEWTPWSESSTSSFDNLSFGQYQFEVRSKIGNQVNSNNASYKFKILKPWYLSHMAIIGYIVLTVVIGFIIHSMYRGYYKRQRKRLIIAKERELEIKELESQQQIMQFRNENLQLDIENKSRELGLSTMNLIQKNEVLNDIKNQLGKVSSLKEIKEVMRLINRQLNTTADWKVFEEAFNNADKEFLKSVKSKHPNLTSNDLRLCAYLRLNLSSKEIAPLLNISHKSVEVKRYRLRKKMNLDHDINLTDYILQI